MKRISEFLTKPVVSLYDSKTEGIIKTVYFDKSLKKLKWFVLFDNDEHAEDCAIKTADIFNVGENAIIIRNDGCLNLELSTISNMDKQSPINNNVYTTKGKFMGTVVDVEVDEKFNVKNVVLNNGTVVDVKKVASSGLNALILQDEEKQIQVAKYKKKFPKIIPDQPSVVRIMDQDLNIKQTVAEETSANLEENNVESDVLNNSTNATANESLKIQEVQEPATKDLHIKKLPTKKYVLNKNTSIPSRISTNHNFLIGRQIEKNIYSVNKVLLAKKGTKITQKTIDMVNQHYKLRELIQFSK